MEKDNATMVLNHLVSALAIPLTRQTLNDDLQKHSDYNSLLAIGEVLIQSIYINNPMIQKLCGGENNETCNPILSSKAAKVTDELSWSEVGFFQFATSWLVLLFSRHRTPIIHILAMLSLSYTFYSIYLQCRIVRLNVFLAFRQLKLSSK